MAAAPRIRARRKATKVPEEEERPEEYCVVMRVGPRFGAAQPVYRQSTDSSMLGFRFWDSDSGSVLGIRW
jgi:hypothetical protein